MIWEVSCLTHEPEPVQRAALFIKPRLKVLDLQRDFEICRGIRLERQAAQRLMSQVRRDISGDA